MKSKSVVIIIILLFLSFGLHTVARAAEIRNEPHKSPTILIDIPGVNWKGEHREGDWGNLLNFPVTIYVIHEGSSPFKDWDLSDYDKVVKISGNVVTGVQEGPLRNTIESAMKQGRDIHLIIDQNVTFSAHLTKGTSRENRWAASVADFALSIKPENYFSIVAVHSNGSEVPPEMRYRPDYAIIASPRGEKSFRLLSMWQDVPIDFITGRWDAPAWRWGGIKNANDLTKQNPLVRVIRLKDFGDPFSTHSKLQNIWYKGNWLIYENGSYSSQKVTLAEPLIQRIRLYQSIKSEPSLPSYWTRNKSQGLSEAKMMVNMVQGKRALVVGGGPVADRLFQDAAKRLGRENVKRLGSTWSSKFIQAQARKFSADAVLGVRPVATMWTYGDRGTKSMTEAKTMTEMFHGRRVVVVGRGKEADFMYSQMSARLGKENVLRIPSIPDDDDNDTLQKKAYKFNADGILAVKPDEIPGYHQPHLHPPEHEKGKNKVCNTYPGAMEHFKKAQMHSHEINKARNPGAYGWPGKPEYIWGQSASNIGGVMLQDTAKVSGSEGVPHLAAGSFSLIFQNGNAEIDVTELRRFLTALWAVYFSDSGPGVSIDPIAPGVDKHLVRYIGKVINTDLARVMRVADYMMKRWAVGTDHPDIPGFKSVDELSAQYGIRYLGAHRRFWFVPEDMRFKLSGNALLFDSGRMTVKTEYVFLNKGAKAEPADEAYARFFTEHYEEIAERYPVYQELFEYARLVSLARYLKEKGVPLLWFLLSNKDMVITEDSPGVVDALAKRSDYFEYLKIEGGVDLAVPSSNAHYVMDAEASQAISKALALYGPGLLKGSSALSSKSITFETERKDFTLTPSPTITLSGNTVSGDKYQTDLALRYGKKPGLELVRYYDPGNEELPIFGKGWHLMIPYKVEPWDDKKIKFLNAVIPARMAVVNLLTGRREVLTFSTTRYSIAGYVPDKLAKSNLIGLFLMSNGSFRLADKLGNEFQFDPTGVLTEMVFSKNYDVKFTYGYEEATRESFDMEPYRITPERGEYATVEVGNGTLYLPKRLTLIDGRGKKETFVFSKQNRFHVIGYLPSRRDGRFEVLAMMTDGSLVLKAKNGEEIMFNPAGRFKKVRARVVKGLSQGAYKVAFKYEFRKGMARIREARLLRQGRSTPLYAVNYGYDSAGRLCEVKTPSGRKLVRYTRGKVMVAQR